MSTPISDHRAHPRRHTQVSLWHTLSPSNFTTKAHTTQTPRGRSSGNLTLLLSPLQEGSRGILRRRLNTSSSILPLVIFLSAGSTENILPWTYYATAINIAPEGHKGQVSNPPRQRYSSRLPKTPNRGNLFGIIGPILAFRGRDPALHRIYIPPILQAGLVQNITLPPGTPCGLKSTPC